MDKPVKGLHLGAFGITVFATFLWGISGIAAQILFQRYLFPPVGLVTIRLFLACGILFVFLRPKWPGRDWKRLVVLAAFGILPSQLFYLLAIAYSNVAVALLLQLLFLPMVVAYEIFEGIYRFSFWHIATILLAMFGAFLLITGSPFSLQLHVTSAAVLFGVLSAIGVAVYTLVPKPLVKRYNPWSVTMWSFLIAGIISLPFGAYSLLHTTALANTQALPNIAILVLAVTILGTVLAYGLYIRGRRQLTATESAIAAVGEPIFATALLYFVLGTLLTPFQYVGGALIVVSMILLNSVVNAAKK
ncbi:MAG TPA: DMT family transporter [Candidatus Acidoferrum sp.]|nr:DMT family transporter [Candidatus Acidoferrum sp.]